MKKELLNKRFLVFGELTQIQDGLNEFTVKDWKTHLGLDHFRVAIYDEGAELLNSMSWKWWKQSGDVDEWNVKIEVVDILHFALSMFILNHHKTLAFKTITFGTDIYEDISFIDDAGMVDHSKFISLVLDVINDDDDPYAMNQLISACGITFEELSATYIAKVTLNEIRQREGYKTGGYQKVVDGIEDNQLLKGAVDQFLADKTKTLQNVVDMVNSQFEEIK